MTNKIIKEKLRDGHIVMCAPQQIYVDSKLRDQVNKERKKLKITWSALIEAMFKDFLDKS